MPIPRRADYGDAGWMMAELESFAFEFSPDMELYCERFRLIEALKRV